MKKPRPLTTTLLALLIGTAIATVAAGRRSGGGTAGQDPAPASAAAPHERVRILVSGSLLGRLEPCGCASGQLGGLARRMQHVAERRDAYDLLLEGGNLIAEHAELDRQKLETAVLVLFGMQRRYDALGLGPLDLGVPLDAWTTSMIAYEVPVLAADLTSEAPDWPAKPFVEKDVRGTTVRITSLALAVPAALPEAGAPVQVLPPLEGWRRGTAGADPATLRVLMLHGTDETARRLVPRLEPAPDLVLCFDQGYNEPRGQPELVGKVPVVYPGIRGRILLDLSLARTPEGPRVGYDLVPLQGSRTVPGGGGDPSVKDVLLAHRQQVKEDDVLTKMARQLPTANGAAYVGTQVCGGCHPSALAAFEKSKHARAWQTLVDAEADPKRYGWPVTAYPDCVGCHVAGYREQTGFVSFEETPHLAAVGCEQCHGAGSDHVTSGGTKPMGKVGGGTPSVVCTRCHDFEQSPTFVYSERWPLIEHAREKR
jgi:hypothetical protein